MDGKIGMFVAVTFVLLHRLCDTNVPQLNLQNNNPNIDGSNERYLFYWLYLINVYFSLPQISWHAWLKADLAQHVGSKQVVLILQDAHGGDGRLLMEATGLPAVIPATALPQVNAEDLSWSASIKQHRHLQTNRCKCLFHIELGTTHSLEEMSHPESKLLSQNVTARAVRLCPACFCIFQYHPMRETCIQNRVFL